MDLWEAAPASGRRSRPGRGRSSEAYLQGFIATEMGAVALLGDREVLRVGSITTIDRLVDARRALGNHLAGDEAKKLRGLKMLHENQPESLCHFLCHFHGFLGASSQA